MSAKPIPMQAEVIARHIAGQSNSQIARDLGISRNTVPVILAEADLGNYVTDAKENCLALIPKALANVAIAIEGGNLKASLALLRGVGLFADKLVVEAPKPVETGDMPTYFDGATADSRSINQPN